VKVLNFPSTAGFKPFSKFFCKESVMHPAKANLYLLYYLIKRYTKPGDVILDPMAGTYSSCIIASLLNRHSIGVDIEEKFYRWGLKNKELLEKAGEARGEMVILKGDARRLSEILKKKVDKILTSPPYSAILSRGEGPGATSIMNPSGYRLSSQSRYSERGENIGNLPHGSIDTIITSPPYADAIITSPPYLRSAERGGGINRQRVGDVEIGCSTLGRTVEHPEAIDNLKEYGVDAIRKNIGNLKGETYLEAMLKVYKECFKVLKPNGRMILIVKDFIRNKRIVPLHEHTIMLCKKVGFKLVDHLLLKLPQRSFWRIIYERKWDEEKEGRPCPKIEYEHILVFVKGNS